MLKSRFNSGHTMAASCFTIINQAIVNNFAPLLFLTFQKEFGVSLELIGLIISINFGIQLLIDLVGAKYVDKIGYRTAIVASNVAAFIGTAGYGIFPFIMDPYAGILVSVIISATGGGLAEVLVSPIVEALPTQNKSGKMAFLHSCYCWGHCGIVILSTLFFNLAGLESWRFLAFIWSVIPFLNTFFFMLVPIYPIVPEGKQMSVKQIITNKLFIVFAILMFCSGSAEISMAQWSSLFAESGLGVSKTMGDLLGPCCFAITMGIARTFYSVKSERINLRTFLIYSGILSVISYLITVFARNPVIGLMGCALCGLAVGMMWPGVISLSAKHFPRGGTAMFALIAFSGDCGASLGPGLVGFISEKVQSAGTSIIAPLVSFENVTQLSLKTSLLFAAIFPFIMAIVLLLVPGEKGTKK